MAADQLPIVDAGFDPRLLVVRRGAERYGVEGRMVMEVAREGAEMQIGFIHAGYSAPDPDGRQAILTLTLTTAQASLTPADRQALHAKGIRMDHRIQVAARGLELDVELPLDRAEEKRLRQAAGLPRSFKTAVSVPVQLRWKDTNGKELYDLLTDAVRGLRFVVRETVSLRVPTSARVSLEPAAVARFLSNSGQTGPMFRWIGGPAALATALADSGAFVWSSPEPGLAGSHPGHGFADDILATLPVSCDATGACTVPAAALQDVRWSRDLAVQSHLFTATTSSRVWPGQLLETKPAYVKDLTAGAAGLRALLGGN
ncbi:MAG TPA: hypothetical protein VM364_03695 [Vicinamibacterales bacterium]|nr:hypothetical protein [Vicinamibacterales bacterium]